MLSVVRRQISPSVNRTTTINHTQMWIVFQSFSDQPKLHGTIQLSVSLSFSFSGCLYGYSSSPCRFCQSKLGVRSIGHCVVVEPERMGHCPPSRRFVEATERRQLLTTIRKHHSLPAGPINERSFPKNCRRFLPHHCHCHHLLLLILFIQLVNGSVHMPTVERTITRKSSKGCKPTRSVASQPIIEAKRIKQ